MIIVVVYCRGKGFLFIAVFHCLLMHDCDRLTGALTVCVNESLHSVFYRKYHAWMTDIATLRTNVIILIVERSSKT